MGSEINGLDASIGKGQKIVEVKMPKNALIMGIRTQTTDVFRGANAILPRLLILMGLLILIRSLMVLQL